jgi:hypothetical protein
MWKTICKRSGCIAIAADCRAELEDQLVRFNTLFITNASLPVYEWRMGVASFGPAVPHQAATVEAYPVRTTQ